ncbi:MAG: hypothetical protein KBT01_00535 [Clostridiales bacterium]|nr:hypothetical protein [Candidatus Blautia equi]
MKMLVPEEENPSAALTPFPVLSFKMQPDKAWKWGKAYPKRKSVTLFDVNEYNQLIQVKISIPQRADGKEVCPQLETFEKYSAAALRMMAADFLDVRMSKKDFDTKYAFRNKPYAEVLEYLSPYFVKATCHPGCTIRHIWIVEQEFRQRRILWTLGYWSGAWRVIDVEADADYDETGRQLYRFLNAHPEYRVRDLEGQLFICVNFNSGISAAIKKAFSAEMDKIMLIRDSLQIFIILENLQRSSQSYFLTARINEYASQLKNEYTRIFESESDSLRARKPAEQRRYLIDLYYNYCRFLESMMKKFPDEQSFMKKASLYLRVLAHVGEQELTMQLFFKQYKDPVPFYLYEISSALITRYNFGLDRTKALFQKASLPEARRSRQKFSALSSSASIIGQFHLDMPLISQAEFYDDQHKDIMGVIARIQQDILSAYEGQNQLPQDDTENTGREEL